MSIGLNHVKLWLLSVIISVFHCDITQTINMEISSVYHSFKSCIFSHPLLFVKVTFQTSHHILTHLFLAEAARSLCLRFLNQFPTWVGVRPVAWARCLFLEGLG